MKGRGMRDRQKRSPELHDGTGVPEATSNEFWWGGRTPGKRSVAEKKRTKNGDRGGRVLESSSGGGEKGEPKREEALGGKSIQWENSGKELGESEEMERRGWWKGRTSSNRGSNEDRQKKGKKEGVTGRSERVA